MPNPSVFCNWQNLRWSVCLWQVWGTGGWRKVWRFQNLKEKHDSNIVKQTLVIIKFVSGECRKCWPRIINVTVLRLPESFWTDKHAKEKLFELHSNGWWNVDLPLHTRVKITRTLLNEFMPSKTTINVFSYCTENAPLYVVRHTKAQKPFWVSLFWTSTCPEPEETFKRN